MHTAEMRRREAFDTILAETLSLAWSREQGRPVVVRPATDGAAGQSWRYLPRHSTFVAQEPSPAVRRFLADSIRYTRRRWRRPLQFLGGTLLSTRVGMAIGGQPGLVVDPGLPRAADYVILPGNQRIRVFDFGTGRTRVYLKAGFDGGLMAREIALRTSTPGPYSPLTDHDDAMTWFEEAILDGWPLARCPASVDPRSALAALLDSVDAWTLDGARTVDAGAHLEGLATRVRAGLDVLVDRFGHAVPEWNDWLDVLIARGSEGQCLVGSTHGDCQDGNILLDRHGGATLLDWEHHAERWVHYDRMVFALRARYQAGLPDRLRTYMAGGDLRWHPEQAADRAWRAAAVARYLLEDSVFQVEEAARGPFQRVTEGLCDREDGMRSLGPGLRDLWSA